jgi:hypothetical protein
MSFRLSNTFVKERTISKPFVLDSELCDVEIVGPNTTATGYIYRATNMDIPPEMMKYSEAIVHTEKIDKIDKIETKELLVYDNETKRWALKKVIQGLNIV